MQKQKLTKKLIIKKTVQMGAWTVLSRILGFVRTFLTVRYLGAGITSDAFLTAYKLPNSLRKIFAEGALTAAFVPTVVSLIKENKKDTINGLITISFVFFEGIVLALCLLVYIFAEPVIYIIAPGFRSERIAATIPLLKILIFFIFFISSSALLATVLQSAHHFTVPALASVVLNIVIIAGLALSIIYKLPVTYFCYVILIGGILQFLMHVYMYFKLNFSFGPVTRAVHSAFRVILKKFLPSFFSMSVMEINLFIDTMFASALPAGSLSLIDYGARFMQIPLGVFGVAFSTILLPHFSHVSTYAPRRLGFYLLESTKLIITLIIPATFLMVFFAHKIFTTLFMSTTILSPAQVTEAQYIFIAFTIGLFFFSLNKILLAIYYAYHDTITPTIVSLVATVANILLNALFMFLWRAPGLALATTVSSGLQCLLFVWLLHRKFKLILYGKQFVLFMGRFTVGLFIFITILTCFYLLIKYSVQQLVSPWAYFLLESWGFWLWVGPTSGMLFVGFLLMRKYMKIRLYFLD